MSPDLYKTVEICGKILYDNNKAGVIMDTILILFGGFLGGAAVIWLIFRWIRSRIRSFSASTFGDPDLLNALKDIDTIAEDTPRSLNGCDSLLIPRILQDFPDFDINLTKTYIQTELRNRYGSNPDYQFYRLVVARYLPTAVQKTIVFQAALAWTENGQKKQKRFDIHYTYLLGGSEGTVAANCPNCGGTLGYGETQCSYCGARVAHVLKNSWTITKIEES